MNDAPTKDGQSFEDDLSRLLQVKRAHASAEPKPENPAWQNSHHDEAFLLYFIDRLWHEYSQRGNQVEQAQKALGRLLNAFQAHNRPERCRECLDAHKQATAAYQGYRGEFKKVPHE